MADFPSSPAMEFLSTQEPVANRTVTVMGDGDFSVQAPGGVQTWIFTAIYNYITSSELSTLNTFWTTYSNDEFNLGWKDGNTYVAVFFDPPTFERINATYYRAVIRMVGRAS